MSSPFIIRKEHNRKYTGIIESIYLVERKFKEQKEKKPKRNIKKSARVLLSLIVKLLFPFSTKRTGNAINAAKLIMFLPCERATKCNSEFNFAPIESKERSTQLRCLGKKKYPEM